MVFFCSHHIFSDTFERSFHSRGGHGTSSGTPSQSKSKGAVAEGNLKSISLSEENPSQFSPLLKAEIEESVRAEKLIADCQRDASLALKIQSSLVKDKKLKKKPFEVQAALLKEIEEERSKEQRVSDNSVDWCKHKLDYRSDPMKIVSVAISGRKKKDKVSVTMEITREDGSCKAMFVSKLESFGYMEWLEFKDALNKSKSIYRGYVEKINDALINRVAAILKVPSTLHSKPNQFKRKPVSSLSENVVVIKNETSIKFSRESLFGPPPDLSVLDLSLPSGGPYVAGQVLKEPFGIFFRDDEEELRFQRMFIAESKTKPLNKDKSTSELMRISVKQRRLYLYAKEHEEKLQR
ncbi:hypothetical protein L6452_26216 [Arctium lappa]|uniref:Uncharacterized protein n=1 Tax=Arctium lappa TaxID=4217 RepID=A0ACB9AGN4_ARCLA|nr:hypothetical protein L6452_26216 [Arctium lappa]